jgi:hypothetical protein
MNPHVTITEVLGRAEQGITRPFICSADHSLVCYVKGSHAGQRSLCCEQLSGQLARILLHGLPVSVPAFAIAEVSQPLIAGSTRKDIKELGCGYVFASMRVEGGQELSWSSAQGWPEQTMAALLLLDLWLQNEDRSLSAKGGNPNLMVTQIPPLLDTDEEGALWANRPRREMLWAYDFNLAFDEDFDRERFFNGHVFTDQLKRWPDGFREEMEPRLREALNALSELFGELPLEWLHLDGDESMPVQLGRNHVESVLSLPFTDPDMFWKLP